MSNRCSCRNTFWRTLVLLLLGATLPGAGMAAVIDFDGFKPGTEVVEASGVFFSTSASKPLVASFQYETSSAPIGLGVGDGSHEQLLPGDTVTLAFPAGVTSLRARFISTPGGPPGAFRIESSQGSASSSAIPELVLQDGAEVFAVQLTTTKAFLTADLVGVSDELFAFSIDDIVFGNDADGDSVLDEADNCRDVPNPDQADVNASKDDDASLAGVQHYGDACDVDLDDDGVVGPSDFFAVFRPCLGAEVATRPECGLADLDGDGLVAPSDFFARLRPALGTQPGPGVTEP